MADSQTNDPSTPRFTPGVSASEQLRQVSFPLAVRGYERAAVDEFVNHVRALVAELEASQTREGVVQRALDEVGEETASILQRAHATADEITARSRSQADDRLQRAQREADLVRRDADEYSEQVVVDTRLLWDERQRLIEDIRQLADEVLATADDAIERVKMPEPLAAAEADSEPTTGEAQISGVVAVPPVDEEQGEPGPGDEPGFEAAAEGDDTAAYELSEVEAEPAEGQTSAYDFNGQEEPYEAGVPDSADADTAPYRLGAVDNDLPSEQGEPPSGDESGHTVELEALPGGAGEDSLEAEEPHDDPERGWFRGRD